MEFLTNTNIDFLKYRKFFVWVSILLLLIAGIELSPIPFIGHVVGINWGIDFAGGTQLTVALRDGISIDEVRGVLRGAGIDAQIQRFGEESSHQVLIKAPVVAGSEEGSGKEMIEALDASLNSDQSGGFDLNQHGTLALADLLLADDPLALKSGDEQVARNRYEEIAANVLAQRKAITLFHDFSDLDGVADLPQQARDTIQAKTVIGAFNVIQNENVGPQIGSELRRKGFYAVTLSLLGMLFYIWFRFELRFGVGAIVAVFHDFVITLGLFALVDYEFNLSTIAAFLTLVGYSVNDTVVIFDRVRENMRKSRRKPLIDVMNESLNQTLTRTILTSGTTLLAVAALFFFGGEVIRGFAFVMLVGVVIGTYSSVYVASPFALLWEQYFEKRRPGGRRPATASNAKS